ncbi:unnamed protein product [Jaminaea pallidilutea]
MSNSVPGIQRLEVLIEFWRRIDEIHQLHYQMLQDFLADSSKTIHLNDGDIRAVHDMRRVVLEARRRDANLRWRLVRDRSAYYRNPRIIWPARD